MASLTDAYNLALSIISVPDAITDPDATDHVTKTLRRFWPTARDLTLRSFPWACTRKIRVLSLRDQDIPGWTYTYNYPNDCIFALALMPEDGLRDRSLWYDCWDRHVNLRPQRYKFERFLRDDNAGQVIAADLEDAYLLQITRVENPVVYDIGLLTAAAAKLGELVAPTLKVKAEFVEIARQTYEIERSKAAANDFNESQPDEEPLTPSLAARE